MLKILESWKALGTHGAKQKSDFSQTAKLEECGESTRSLPKEAQMEGIEDSKRAENGEGWGLRVTWRPIVI